MYYTFTQNNTGGSFQHYPKESIGYAIIVEADNAADANKQAEKIGLYFNGCTTGADCDCCGDRWYRHYQDDMGTEKPLVYEQEVKEFMEDAGRSWGLPVYVHHKNGKIDCYEPEAVEVK